MVELSVLYDGSCALCRNSAERVRRLDRAHRIALINLHDAGVSARFPQVNMEGALRSMQAVDSSGRVSSGVDAWAEICRVLGWQPAGWLIKMPGIHVLAAWTYGWMARNRYRWNAVACSGGSCGVHHPARR